MVRSGSSPVFSIFHFFVPDWERRIETFEHHLSLTVRAQPPQITILAHVGQFLPQPSFRRVGERRDVLSLITRAP